MKKVAIVGTQGVPAQYGGFETLVENIIGDHRSGDVEYTVFCSGKDYETRRETYKGATLKYIPFLHANGAQSTPYDILSLLHCITGYDTVMVLGVSGGLFLPIFRLLFRKKLIVHIDGREHTRAKWGCFAKQYLRACEVFSVRCADIVIADNKGIQDYVAERYHKESALIAYGGDHVLRMVSEERQTQILQDFQVERNAYAVSICRIEPENNCHITLEAYAQSHQPIVFIGNWKWSKYGQELKERYGNLPNIHIVESVYDLDVLYTLRKHAQVYVHGHSAGGTNPSLVEAMFFGCPILAYDVVYNRETTYNKAYYYKDSTDLIRLSQNPHLNGSSMRALAEQHYLWKTIVKQYEALF